MSRHLLPLPPSEGEQGPQVFGRPSLSRRGTFPTDGGAGPQAFDELQVYVRLNVCSAPVDVRSRSELREPADEERGDGRVSVSMHQGQTHAAAYIGESDAVVSRRLQGPALKEDELQNASNRLDVGGDFTS
ncbi:Hypothetical protein SMAX5B_009166 [Scophthalmus maximus]|uniref:Uncharacterized protein n=1 Tax=Scophthalmus maximus TaxID=52904 RepID=A0A2U9C6D7_SCOMX|nr:Hypothetical protein SMAX5B_009166 [Scophthalmus maximus]